MMEGHGGPCSAATNPHSNSCAVISECGQYRYRLDRQCLGDGTTAIIMVNPSTANATDNDATIRKLIGFGDRNKWGRLLVGNLFAFRATDVRELGRADDPVGPENDSHLDDILKEADNVIYAWGPLGKQPRLLRGRWRYVHKMAEYIGLSPQSIGEPAKCGHPKHPLMLSYQIPILSWKAP